MAFKAAEKSQLAPGAGIQAGKIIAAQHEDKLITGHYGAPLTIKIAPSSGYTGKSFGPTRPGISRHWRIWTRILFWDGF